MNQAQPPNDEDDDEFEESAGEFAENYIQKPGFRGGPHLPLEEFPLGLPGRLFLNPVGGRHDLYGDYAEAFRRNGVSVVIFLIEDNEYLLHWERCLREVYVQEGFEVIHLPNPKHGVPSRENLEGVLRSTIVHLEEGRHVAIHGSAEDGRSALFVACLAKSVLGPSGYEAMRWVMRRILGGMLTRKQRQFVLGYKTQHGVDATPLSMRQAELDQLLTMEGTVQFVAERTKLQHDQVAHVLRLGWPWPSSAIYRGWLKKENFKKSQLVHLKRMCKVSVRVAWKGLSAPYHHYKATVVYISGAPDVIVGRICGAVEDYLMRICSLVYEIKTLKENEFQ